jgi:hypothetical protein
MFILLSIQWITKCLYQIFIQYHALAMYDQLIEITLHLFTPLYSLTAEPIIKLR